MEVLKAALRHRGVQSGQEIQTFEQETPLADRVLAGTDGTGVPMVAGEGMPGKQADSTAKNREAKTIVCCTAESRDPKTGEPRKDKGIGVRRPLGTGPAPERRVRCQGAGGAVRRGGMDKECL